MHRLATCLAALAAAAVTQPAGAEAPLKKVTPDYRVTYDRVRDLACIRITGQVYAAVPGAKSLQAECRSRADWAKRGVHLAVVPKQEMASVDERWDDVRR